MSVGCFLGIRVSYIDEAQAIAIAFLKSINVALNEAGLPTYNDPIEPIDAYCDGLFGRSALDHHSGSCLIEFAQAASANRTNPHSALLAKNPYRLAYLPCEFSEPLRTEHKESIAGRSEQIWIGSAPRLLQELTTLALQLGIPLDETGLSRSVAERINDFAPLFEGDDCSLAEDSRTVWLLLYEGARLAIQHNVALSLAG